MTTDTSNLRARFPVQITFEDQNYQRTGKFGRDFKTGEFAAEYEIVTLPGHPVRRVWRSLAGVITTEY